MVWADLPQLMELGIVDMFLSHLRADKTPALTRVPRKWKVDGDFANLSLRALGGAQALIDDPGYRSQSRAILSAWPGIFKWCSYIYDARVASKSAQDRRIFLDTLVKLFYVLSRFNHFVSSMIGTAGCLELLTKLWVLEDVPVEVESIVLGPIPATTLAFVIKCAALSGKDDMYKRVIQAAGGNSDFVVQLVLSRIKKSTKALNPDLGALAVSWHIELISELCRPTPHPLRRGFFDADVIPTMTRSFAALSRIIVQNPTPNSVAMMVACIDFFSRYLEGDDYLSLVHAVKAGFLGAFLDCSPVFRLMPAGMIETALGIINQVLPPYLVYRSFIEAAKSALEQLDTPHYKALIAQPHVAAVWGPFSALLAKRQPPLNHMHKLKSEGTPVHCDYVKCQLIDVKRSFSKCGACGVAYYCSLECQKLAWKSSHRAVCKETKAEHESHREKGRPKTDLEFLHGLAQWEGDVNFAAFHALAERQFPNAALEDLMPCLDFTRVPQEYSVKLIAPGASGHPGVFFSREDNVAREASFLKFTAKFRGTGTTIIQSVIASGATVEILLTPMSRRNFWTDKNTYSDSSDEELDGNEGRDSSDGSEEGEWLTESEASNERGVDSSPVTLNDLD
ncbi:hypothetical protein B0H17DRAFT_1143541 [Mycena rosella]|uniref:MYND-type domain-containing protein n=1 Tax=Mycena rosella TaxID=1033263 RepID=A0AAD7G4D2_MYCRO|nr:hypothetical protein B0H17DRAFT_1143541 [Mycena rosella]